MPFPMKIQPIDFNSPDELTRNELVKPVVKSRLKRLLERQFPSVLRISSAEKIAGSNEGTHCNRDVLPEFEPSSVCLAKMVQNFIEDNEKQSATVRCGRNCFNGLCNDSSDDEIDSNLTSYADACEVLKSLVPCASVHERNLLADASKIVEKNKIAKQKDDFCRKIVTDGLLALGYDASICKSRWEKSPSYPAGEYEYLDVIIEGERLIIDIDFRSEFEIARSTKSFKMTLQTLPCIFVGKADRLQKIISVVSEAAKQSLKKKGMPFPPWRKAEYVKAKWLSPSYTRTTTPPAVLLPAAAAAAEDTCSLGSAHSVSLESDDLNSEKKQPLIVSPVETNEDGGVFALSDGSGDEEAAVAVKAVVKKWEPPEIKPKKNSNSGVRMVTGLASVIGDEA